MKCPCCNKLVGPSHFACHSGAKGGAAGTGEKKARSPEQARKAALARWAKKNTALGPPKKSDVQPYMGDALKAAADPKVKKVSLHASPNSKAGKEKGHSEA